VKPWSPPIVYVVPAWLLGEVKLAPVESGALIMNGRLGLVPGSTTTGPPANDRLAATARETP
jgi:hypothetical protein